MLNFLIIFTVSSVALNLCFLYLIKDKRKLIVNNLLLREQLLLATSLLKRKKKRILTPFIHKLFWILVSSVYSPWRKVALLTKPNTIVQWHQSIYKIFCKFISRKKSGRKIINKELIPAICFIASNNPNWKATRILGELEKLGYAASLNTVKKYLSAHRKNNNPDGLKDSTWKQFLELHKEYIAAFDFFTIPTWNCKQLLVSFFRFFLSI
ncbi:MAG: hypothetical protein SFU98_01690 [Leptospiraceae bacterium]|nr:hypothetical protein [Leptospiraceae bacterium]